MKWQLQKTLKNLDLKGFQNFAKKQKEEFGEKAVVVLCGEMAAGKTEFVKAITSEASSPTFAIHQSYGNVEHLDLFRLKNEDELESTGFWDLFAQSSGLIFIEWPENMNLALIPNDWPLWKIEIKKDSESTREVSVAIRL
jgi:tRNA threonylcarbamoyladenosine biosynthesis protein TsaE